jgi:hypothetical protein
VGDRLDSRGNVVVWIAAMVIAGPIVTAIVSPEFREAISDFFEGSSGALSPGEVIEHPNKYLWKNM